MHEEPIPANEISEEIPLTREREMTHMEAMDYNFTKRELKIDAYAQSGMKCSSRKLVLIHKCIWQLMLRCKEI